MRLFSWLLNCAYLALILIALPWILWSAFRHGKYREGFSEKLLGLAPQRQSDKPCIWLHAVSVGEVNLLATTIAELASRLPTHEIVISTTTKTGYELARRKYAAHVVFYCPLDFSWAVKSAVRRINPAMLVLAELELWPNLVAAAKRHGAKVAIINGRLGDKSFRGYRRLRPLVAYVLRQLDLIAAQNDETAARFRQLGARPKTVVATGSLKFDGAQTNRHNLRTTELKSLAGVNDSDIIFLAGSTQDPEERYALDIYKCLAGVYPHLRLIVVPRHKERFDEVAALLAKSNLPWQRRTKLQPRALPGDSPTNSDANTHRQAKPESPAPWRVLLIDAIGELNAWWGAAHVGFVGGSFGSRGGQNMLEPAAYGVATCFGPNTWNFRDIVSRLLAAGGAEIVHDQSQLEAFVRRMLERPEEATALGAQAQQLVLSQQGATRLTVNLLCELLDAGKNSSMTKPRQANAA
jgi:3-deoxy-D-manno-octulosonic-acid transferase